MCLSKDTYVKVNIMLIMLLPYHSEALLRRGLIWNSANCLCVNMFYYLNWDDEELLSGMESRGRKTFVVAATVRWALDLLLVHLQDFYLKDVWLFFIRFIKPSEKRELLSNTLLLQIVVLIKTFEFLPHMLEMLTDVYCVHPFDVR